MTEAQVNLLVALANVQISQTTSMFLRQTLIESAQDVMREQFEHRRRVEVEKFTSEIAIIPHPKEGQP